MFERMSLTVLLAPEAARTPIVPTMKYDKVLCVSPDPFTRYAEKSGTPVGRYDSCGWMVAVWLRPAEGRAEGPGVGAADLETEVVENRRVWTEANEGAVNQHHSFPHLTRRSSCMHAWGRIDAAAEGERNAPLLKVVADRPPAVKAHPWGMSVRGPGMSW